MKYNAPLPLLQSEQLRLQTSSPHKKYIFDRILTTSFAVKHSGPAHVHLTFIFSVQFSMFSSCGRNHPLDDKRPHFLCSAQCALFPHVTDELRFQKLYLIMIFSVGLGPPSTSPSGLGLHLSLSIEACSQEYTLDKEYYFHISTFSSSDRSQF